MTDETEALANAYALLASWDKLHDAASVVLDAEYAPEEEAAEWAEDLVGGMVSAMAFCGETVQRGPVRIVDEKVLVELDGREIVVRDVGVETSKPRGGVEYTLSRFAEIAARRGCVQRWYRWFSDDADGKAYFVTPHELITPSGIDVRDLSDEHWEEVLTG